MGIFDFFKGKKKDEEEKEKKEKSVVVRNNPGTSVQNRDLQRGTNGVTIKRGRSFEMRGSSFAEASISKNAFNASKEATIGREVGNDILSKRANTNIEQSKGWFFEAKQTTGFNIDAAEKGSNARAVMLDSKISCDTVGAKSDSGSPHDIEIYENGKATGNKIQAKAANTARNSVSYQDDPKYKGMQRAVPKGQIDEYKKNPGMKKISRETAKNLTEEIKHTDAQGREIKSKAVSLDEIKRNKTMQKVENYVVEGKHLIKSAAKSGANAMGTAFLLNLVDDAIEGREISLKKTTQKAVSTGVKVGGYTLAKDIIVNKLKYSASAFTGVMTGLDVAKDVKRICELSAKGVAKETIFEEIDATIAKAGVGLISNVALVFPGGAGLSVGINYIGNKLIQKYFYSEIAMYIRGMREKNNALAKELKDMEMRIKELDRYIDNFLVVVDQVCEERKEIVTQLEGNFTQQGINMASVRLTGEKIEQTTDDDIDSLFDDGLTI